MKSPPKKSTPVFSGLLVGVLIALSLTISVILVLHEGRRQQDSALALLDSEALLLASFVREALATQNYQLTEYFFQEWGSSHSDVVMVGLVVRDGVTMVEYRRSVAAEIPFTTSRDVSYGYDQHVKLTLVKDFVVLRKNLVYYAAWVLGISLLVALVIAGLFQLTVRKRESELLAQLVRVDGLTGVANRRHFDEALRLEWSRALRASQPLSLLMVDIDFFKAYNDALGHQEGDMALRRVAKALASVVKRPADLVARYGGEEFVTILPETAESGAMHMATLIQMGIQALMIPHPASPVATVVSASIGVATCLPTSASSPEALLKCADEALYEAKRAGRNRIGKGQISDGPIADRLPEESH